MLETIVTVALFAPLLILLWGVTIVLCCVMYHAIRQGV